MSGSWWRLLFTLMGFAFFYILKMLVDLSYIRHGHIIHKSIGLNDAGFVGVVSRIG
jgi:hypothetical protein